ncbi:MAG TPA: hypothetical protein PLP42_05255 [Acidobacteriota bacterium]|nr:hypothetical protein [Acidobacteriota bacterium]
MRPRSMTAFTFNFVVLLLVTVASVSTCVQASPGWRQGGPPGAEVQAIALDPTDSNTVYLVSSGGVWKSTDAGLHWFAASKDLCAFNLTAIAIDPAQPSTLYVGGEEGFFRSTDGGASWQISGDHLKPSLICSVAVDPRGLGIVYRGGYYGVFRSTDHGMTWADHNGGTNLPTVVQILIDPTDPDRILSGLLTTAFSGPQTGGPVGRRSTQV